MNILMPVSFLIFVYWIWFLAQKKYYKKTRPNLLFLMLGGVIFLRPLIGKTFWIGGEKLFPVFVLIITMFLLIAESRKFIYYSPKKNSLDPPDLFSDDFYSCFDILHFLFCLTLFGLLFSAISLGVGLNQTLHWCVLFCLYLSLKISIKNKTDLALLFFILGAAALIVIFYGLYQYFFGFTIMREFINNNPGLIGNNSDFLKRLSSCAVFSTFIYPPVLAAYLNMIFFSFLGYFFPRLDSKNILNKKKSVLCLYGGFLALIIAVLFLTRSKGGIFSWLCAMVIFVTLKWIFKNKKIKTRYLAVIFLALGISLILIFLKIKFLSAESIIASLGVRIEYWKAAIKMIAEKPWFGWGPGAFSFIYPMFKTKFAEETIMAHNSYLQILAEGGCFSFFIFTAAWIVFLIKGKKLIRKAQTSKSVLIGIYCALISFLIQNFMDFGFYESQTAFIAYTLTAMFFLTYAICENKKENSINLNINFICGSVFLITILILALILYASPGYLGQIYLFKFQKALAAGRPQSARQWIQKACIWDPLNSDFIFKRALFEESIKLQPQETSALYKKSSKEILKLYNKAISLNPYVAYYYYRLGKFLMQGNDPVNFNQALFYFIRAAEIYPLKPFYHEQLAQIYDIMGKKELAGYERNLQQYLKRYYFTGTK